MQAVNGMLPLVSLAAAGVTVLAMLVLSTNTTLLFYPPSSALRGLEDAPRVVLLPFLQHLHMGVTCSQPAGRCHAERQ